MVTLEELDEHKTGMSEVSRNVRQVTRSIDSLIGASLEETVEKLNLGVPLNSLGHSDATGSLFFQTEKIEINISLGLEVEKPDNQILGIVKKLVEKYKKKKVILVSKDINIRIKAKALSSSLDICSVYPAISVNIIAASFLSTLDDDIEKFMIYYIIKYIG